MSPVAPFKYDVFVSYSSNDRPWAKQLADDLTTRNFKVFYDRTNLDIGDPWEEQLDDSLDLSQHLIVLWSGSSAEKKYVEYERTYFHTKARQANSTDPQRKEILVLLEDPQPTVRNSLQIITTLKEASAYAKGIDQRDVNKWNSVIAQIEKTIRNQSDALRILVAILATNRDFLNDLDFDRAFNFIGSMNSVIGQMGISSKAELLNYYGATFDDWCPFGNNANIWTVLDNLKGRVANATANKFQIEW